MANVKITELTADTNPVSTDVLPIVDVSADTTKKVTIADLLENAGNGSAGSPAFAFDSDPDTGMYRGDTNKLGFATAGTGRLFIDANGKVGIGTDSPTELLHLSHDSAYKILLERTGAVPSQVVFGNSGQTALISNNTNGVAFQTGATPSEKLRINASGNCGIGTSSPYTKLNVKDFSAFTLNTNTIDYTVFVEGGDTAGEGNYGASIGFSRINSSGRTGAVIATKQTSTDADQQGLSFLTHQSASTSSNLKESMLITHDGLVGIGTSSPGASLDIRGSGLNPTIHVVRTDAQTFGAVQLASGDNANYVQSLGDKDFQISTNSSEKLRVTSAGNVGIGTSNPSTRLDVVASGSSYFPALEVTNSTGTGSSIRSKRGLSLEADYDNNSGASSSEIVFKTDDSQRMVINASGLVGIGTSTPAARLHAKVDGTGVDIQKWTADLGVNTRDMVVKSPAADNNDDPFTFQTANSIAFQIDTSEAVRIDAAGRLGVGTNNPSSVLHTTGTRDYTGTTPTKSSYDNNFQSGNAYVAIGQSNSIPTIQGHGAGTSFNLALAPNAGNVAIGSTNADAALSVKARINVPPFKVSGPSSEFARIDEFGRLLVGASAYTSAGDSFSPENLVYVENSGSSGFQTFVGIANRSDAVGASIVLGKTRGTAVGSNTIVQNGDQLGTLRFVGADGNDRSPVAGAIECEVDGTPGSNDMPGRLVFQTTSDSGASPTTRMTIDSQGALNIFNGTAPTASATNGVKLYAQDVSSSSELKVRDEAGNVTTLSPHNFDLIPEGPSEDMAWSYYSERDGKRINVDMLKAIRLLEQLSGEQLVFTS